MVYNFCGLDMKTGVKLVFWIYFIENLAVYLMTILSAYNINSLDPEEFAKYKAVLLYQVELEDRIMPGLKVHWWNFSLIFPFIGVITSALCLLFEKSKALRFIWLIHQGLSFLLLFTTLINYLTSNSLISNVDKAMLSLVFTPLIVFKFYSWLVIEASISQIKLDERKEKFGPQWITNSLMCAPSLRLTLPVVTAPTVESYGRL